MEETEVPTETASDQGDDVVDARAEALVRALEPLRSQPIVPAPAAERIFAARGWVALSR